MTVAESFIDLLAFDRLTADCLDTIDRDDTMIDTIEAICSIIRSSTYADELCKSLRIPPLGYDISFFIYARDHNDYNLSY